MATDAPYIIDSNCYLGTWPTRRLGISSAEGIVELAEENGVSICLVSTLDAIFHRDISSANSELRRELAPFGKRMAPVPTINPLSPVEEPCHSKLVRITPTHHLYSLRNRSLKGLMAGLESDGGVLFISMRMRDERLRHRMMRTRPVRMDELISALEPFPGLQVVVNNARSAEIEGILQNTGDNVLVGCAWSLPVGFLERMVDAHGDHRIVYGSNVPLHYYQSSLLQINGADISQSSRKRILNKNIAALIYDSPGLY